MEDYEEEQGNHLDDEEDEDDGLRRERGKKTKFDVGFARRKKK